MHNEQELKQYDRWGVRRPEHIPHGTAEDIRANLKRLETTNWRLEGNKLIADTDQGPLVQFIPTNYVCRGTDEQGLPILDKLEL